jgi:F-type H+-transporting ATPase subunit delta
VNGPQAGIAGTYARALLSLAQRSDEVDRVGEELAGVVEVLDRAPDLEGFFASPLVAPAARRAAVEKLLRGRASDLLVDALQVANDKGRLNLLRSIDTAYHRELEDLRGRIGVRVGSAIPLSAALRERLRAAASRYTGREAVLEERVDPELLGGLVLEIGDRKIEASVAGRLHRTHQRLIDRGAQELHSGRQHVVENGGHGGPA